jgi:hypothetical protein
MGRDSRRISVIGHLPLSDCGKAAASRNGRYKITYTILFVK